MCNNNPAGWESSAAVSHRRSFADTRCDLGHVRSGPRVPTLDTMNHYTGTAVLLLGDGRQFDAAADLTKDSSGSWHGTLTFHDQTLVPVLVNVDAGHLLIDGRRRRSPAPARGSGRGR